MKKNIFKTLSFKLSMIIILLLLAVSTTFTIKTQLGAQNLISENQEEAEQIVINGINADLESQYEELQFALEGIINNEALLKAFADRDRETLSSLTVNIMPGLADLGVEQFQFHLPDATSFFRVHKPEQFGDDLSSFRITVVEANKQKEIIKGFEGGVAGAGIRYVVPLDYQGTHIGTVEMGLGLNQEMLNSFKQQYNGEWYFYAIDNDSFKLLDSTNEEDGALSITDENLEKLKANEPVILYNKPIKTMIIPIADFTGEVKWFVTRVSDETYVESLINDQMVSNVLFGLIITLVGLVLTIIFAQRITKPIVKIANQVRLVADGDLSITTVNVKSNDEVGQLANDFNKMILNLRQLINEVATTSEHVASTSEELSASSEQTSKASEQITTAIQDVANSVERQAMSSNDSFNTVTQISKDVEQIDNKIESMARLSLDANNNANSGNKIVIQAIDYMNAINEKVKVSTNHVNSLGDRSKEISQIVSMITDIADQTNLLALNAAIEAARAGENGLGFAVVADEVRKLAAQSGNAANKIKSLIEIIQTETKDAVESMNEGNKAVVEGSLLVNQAGNAFKEIMMAIDNVSKQAMDVSNSIQQISKGTQEMVTSVEEISKISERIAANTQDVAASTEEQNASMEEIASAANMLTQATLVLTDAINKFKL